VVVEVVEVVAELARHQQDDLAALVVLVALFLNIFKIKDLLIL
jgi:hypothetical protein